MGASKQPRTLRSIGAAIILILFATTAARADSVSLVTSTTALGANDTIVWSQLGADATETHSQSQLYFHRRSQRIRYSAGSQQPRLRGMPIGCLQLEPGWS